MTSKLLPTTLALLLIPLAACSNDKPATAPGAGTAQDASKPQTTIGRHIESAMDKARKELREGNLSLNNNGVTINDNGGNRRNDLPKAEITPTGDLLIEGKQVAIDATQRKQLLDYRARMIAVAEAGMTIGVQGADLGVRAAGDALRSIFTGDTEGVERRAEAEAAKIEAESQKLCTLLPPLLAAQDTLAASLPAFKPYARMDSSDIENCGNELSGKANQTAVRDEIRQSIRGGIREATQQATADQASAAAEAADKTATPKQ